MEIEGLGPKEAEDTIRKIDKQRKKYYDTYTAVVLDADGINALEGHIDVLDARGGSFTVLTPHDGEFVRIGGDLSGGDRG